MAVDVYVHPDTVDITFSGLDRLVAFTDRLLVPIDVVTSARVRPVAEVRADLGLRTFGTGLPGVVLAGSFAFRDRPGSTHDTGFSGERQLWCVYRDAEALVIDTMWRRPSRIVLQHPDRHNLAWLIGERIDPDPNAG
jgi:hypothetical protein